MNNFCGMKTFLTTNFNSCSECTWVYRKHRDLQTIGMLCMTVWPSYFSRVERNGICRNILLQKHQCKEAFCNSWLWSIIRVKNISSLWYSQINDFFLFCVYHPLYIISRILNNKKCSTWIRMLFWHHKFFLPDPS